MTIAKTVIHGEKDILLCFVYLPPDGSQIYANYQCAGVDLVENHLLNININIDSYELLILGDLNARIGDKKDYFTFQTN